MTETAQSRIVGGTPESGYDAVVRVWVGRGKFDRHQCTGTLIASKVVLTAAHCFDKAIVLEGNPIPAVSVVISNPLPVVSKERDVLIHRRYQKGMFDQFDIGFVRLHRPFAGIEPLAVNVEPLSTDHVGQMIRSLGYGDTPVKEQAIMPILAVLPELLAAGGEEKNTCHGDSGGPHLLSFDDNGVAAEKIVAITSSGTDSCRGVSHHTRVDRYADLVRQVLSAWGDGDCVQDGECCTDNGGCPSGCDFPDPDCDPCGLDGTCTFGCSQIDLDCDLGGLLGDMCNEDKDCESRLCIPTRDQVDKKFCSRLCDPSIEIAGSDCEDPLRFCSKSRDGRFLCQSEHVPLLSDGESCTDSDNCASGLCDGDSVCMKSCTIFEPDCPDALVCRRGVAGALACRLPEQGGCGIVDSNPGTRDVGGVLFLVFVVGCMLARRRFSV